MRLLLWSCSLFVLLEIGARKNGGSAHAQSVASAPANASSCEDDAICNRFADEGYEHLQAGQLDKARRAYEAAYARRRDPKLLYNLARVLHKAGRPSDAAGYYQRYLDAGAEGIEGQRQKAQQYLKQSRSEAATKQVLTLQPQPLAPAPGAATLPDTKEAPSQTPLYRKWWLWAAVGVATAGVAVGLGLGVAARRPDLTDAIVARPF